MPHLLHSVSLSLSNTFVPSELGKISHERVARLARHMRQMEERERDKTEAICIMKWVIGYLFKLLLLIFAHSWRFRSSGEGKWMLHGIHASRFLDFMHRNVPHLANECLRGYNIVRCFFVNWKYFKIALEVFDKKKSKSKIKTSSNFMLKCLQSKSQNRSIKKKTMSILISSNDIVNWVSKISRSFFEVMFINHWLRRKHKNSICNCSIQMITLSFLILYAQDNLKFTYYSLDLNFDCKKWMAGYKPFTFYMQINF